MTLKSAVSAEISQHRNTIGLTATQGYLVLQYLLPTTTYSQLPTTYIRKISICNEARVIDWKMGKKEINFIYI